jgi:glycosyltransferase involved in cell wall biosynthesis
MCAMHVLYHGGCMISIVIPALNEEKYLPECLHSLKEQSCANEPEIIVVDNGSTDGTVEVAKAGGVRLISCERRGVAYARQAGAEAAKGEVIVQVDADTTYPPGWLERIEEYFVLHPKSAGVAGRYVYLKPAAWAPIEHSFRKYLNKTGMVVLRRPVAVSGANFAFRRSAFVQSGGYDPASLYPDQWGIARQISRFGRIDYDHQSIVKTSARRVAKPLYVIAFEIVRNCCHIAWHFVRHCSGTIGKLVHRRMRNGA